MATYFELAILKDFTSIGPWLVITFLFSLALSLFLTPVMIRAARKYNIVDHPDGDLKNHKGPIPYLGGLGIYIAFVVTLGLLLRDFNDNIVLGVLLAGSMILILGLIDDFGALTPIIKLLGQVLAAFILYKSDIKIQIAVLPYGVNMLLTVLWIVGICNAFNLLDVMDGLAAGVALICAAFLFLTVMVKGNNPVIAVMTLALAGSITGFLRFNLEPARIYMGDAGSMFIGFMLGSLSMMVSYSYTNPVTCLAPIFILGFPIFDTLFVVYNRFREKRPVFRGSHDHLALKLRKRSCSTRKPVLICFAATVGLNLCAVLLLFLPGSLWPLLLVGLFLAALPASVYLLSRMS